MDVAIFRTLKGTWKEKVKKWRTDNFDKPIIKKRHFAPLLKEVIAERVKAGSIL